MPKIISFIGWHNSGKTTLASSVATKLIAQGLQIGVVKSTKENDIDIYSNKKNDSAVYAASGADILLATPDQIILQQKMAKQPLKQLADRYFSEVDLVIGEGFKYEEGINKIEIYCGGEVLATQVSGVLAIVLREELPPQMQRKLADTGVWIFSASSDTAATIAQCLTAFYL